MDAEMKVPTMEKVVEKKVYEDNKRDYASKGLAGTALGLGIGGLALALLNGGLPTIGSRAMFGGIGAYGMPENVNINTTSATTNEPTALSVLMKENQDEVNLLQEMYNLKLGTERQFYAMRNTDVAEKFSLYKGYMDGLIALNDRQHRDAFSLYKGYTESDAALKDAMVQQGFSLYKGQRDLFDAVDAKYAARFAELDKKVAVMEAVRPYQDKLLMGYTDQKCCRMITGQLVLPSTPVVSGYGSYSSCNCPTSPVANPSA